MKKLNRKQKVLLLGGKEMIVLHIASLDNNKASGVSIVVPEHVRSQKPIVNVGLLNCSDIDLDIAKSKLDYPFFDFKKIKKGGLSNLPIPFNNPDIVIFHGVYFYKFLKISRYLKINRIPYVLIPHGSLTSYAQKKKLLKKKIGNILFFKNFIKEAKAIQYLTTDEQEMSNNFVNKSFVSGNGIHINEIKNHEKFEGNINVKAFQFTFIGRLDPFHKGIDILLQACSKISNEMREKNLKLSINGPDYQNGRRKVEDLIKELHLEDIVSLKGPIFGVEKANQLQETDVFVLTSRFEGQPLAVMEALAMGVPVLVTPGTNIADEVKNYKCGWKANFTVEDISNTILECSHSREKLKEFSINARKFAIQNYSWSTVAKQSINEYKKIL